MRSILFGVVACAIMVGCATSPATQSYKANTQTAARHLEEAQTFETIWYRPKNRGFSLRAFTDTGTLTIGKDALEFTSKKKQLTVPYSSVLEVRWERVGLDTYNMWAVVEFDAEGSEGFAAFKDGEWLGWGGDSKEIYIKLKQALVRFLISSPPAGD